MAPGQRLVSGGSDWREEPYIGGKNLTLAYISSFVSNAVAAENRPTAHPKRQASQLRRQHRNGKSKEVRGVGAFEGLSEQLPCVQLDL